MLRKALGQILLGGGLVLGIGPSSAGGLETPSLLEKGLSYGALFATQAENAAKKQIIAKGGQLAASFFGDKSPLGGIVKEASQETLKAGLSQVHLTPYSNKKGGQKPKITEKEVRSAEKKALEVEQDIYSEERALLALDKSEEELQELVQEAEQLSEAAELNTFQTTSRAHYFV